MPLILNIETATSSCSVALALDGQLLAFEEQNERNIHAGSLTVFIEQVMKSAQKEMSDLDAVAVSMGPGSYTGLRIGVSTAKGLCYALDIPLIAINTLEAMAAGILKSNKWDDDILLCPMIDARRMEVYTALYSKTLASITPIEAKIIDSNSFSSYLENQKIVFFGDGAPKFSNTLLHPNAEIIPSFINSARDMADLSLQKIKASNFEDTAYFEPFYLKDFVALQPKQKV